MNIDAMDIQKCVDFCLNDDGWTHHGFMKWINIKTNDTALTSPMKRTLDDAIKAMPDGWLLKLKQAAFSVGVDEWSADAAPRNSDGDWGFDLESSIGRTPTEAVWRLVVKARMAVRLRKHQIENDQAG